MEEIFAGTCLCQCQHNWTSHQVVILFHIYWEPYGRQGCVRMRFFQQQCYECFSEKYEEPQFTEESVDSVLERLVTTIRKKCYRENITSDSYKLVPLSSGPHKPEYCEACQLGIHKRYYSWPQGAGHLWESSNWDPESTQYSEAVNLIDTPVSSPLVHSTPPGYWKRCVYIFSISIIAAITLAIIFYYLFIHLTQAP
ncbi:receptor-transporting protein 2-like isoform X2 [Sceloporus undulatus]|uniref:receptor-transporting protein 2-like isoform X2 n=1 Tax=Sceloporus undulatus TaxID=8520 RepID=UPI001C4D7563|nr:receptor-transporting protein 2-like isoform X2 [Sceloporus undulatus]